MIPRPAGPAAVVNRREVGPKAPSGGERDPIGDPMGVTSATWSFGVAGERSPRPEWGW
jgi:hypothetical protein